MKKLTVAHDVSELPTFAYGAKNPLWWGTQSFMLIEGLGFAMAFATYLYIYNQNPNWPLAPLPSLPLPSLLLGLLFVSEVANVRLKKAAGEHDLKKVRKGLLIMSAVGVAALVIRWFEFQHLNVSWDTNAYGSIVWYLLGYHTTHLLTDVVETLVMTAMIHIGPVDMRRFPEVEDNQDYWHFVVLFWLATYAVIYWFPRWLGNPP